MCVPLRRSKSTEHEAAFKQIKLIQGIYDLCEEKHVITEIPNAKFEKSLLEPIFDQN